MVYLGPQAEIQTSWLSPSGRHALVTTTPKGYDAGRVAQMPVYVTASGYPEMQAESPRIGRNPKPPTTLWLVDTQARRARVLDLAGFRGSARTRSRTCAAPRGYHRSPVRDRSRSTVWNGPRTAVRWRSKSAAGTAAMSGWQGWTWRPGRSTSAIAWPGCR